MSNNIIKSFFVIEGVDGSGKTTLCKLIQQHLNNVVTASQPSNGFYGAKIREVLQKKVKLSQEELMYLFIQDRQEQQSWILEKINQGKKVVLDRYLLSSMAYQGLEIDMNDIWEANFQFIIPEYIFFIDILPEEALKRKKIQNSNNHQQDEIFEVLDTQNKIYKNYQQGIEILKKHDFSIIILNGNQNMDQVFKDCLQYIGD